ncbi:MAG: BREX system P-loop protein BrxC, partial [Firmicutes bacterium]|nr:BREX system P-loop protein BrxC [Bacillota bacterium]
KGLEYFAEFTKGLDSVSFFTKLRDLEDNLLNWEEDVSYVKSFFENQKDIFDKGLHALERFTDNKDYLVGKQIEDDAKKLHGILTDPVPYTKIKEIPELVNKIDEQIQAVLSDKKVVAKRAVQQDFDYLTLRASQEGVSDNTKSRIRERYEDLLNRIDHFVDIIRVDATITQSATFKQQQEQEIAREIQEYENERKQGGGTPGNPVPTPQKEQVKVSNLMVVKTLRTEEDVDKLLNTLSVKLKQIIKSNKQIEFVE